MSTQGESSVLASAVLGGLAQALHAFGIDSDDETDAGECNTIVSSNVRISNMPECEDHGMLVSVRMRTGRHVDAIELEFEDGHIKQYGNDSGGEVQDSFEINAGDREYLVRIQGRQNKYLDGIQFITNYGRASRWYGGRGGRPFASRASAGSMIVGLHMEGDFCPCFRQIRIQAAPSPPKYLGILRLLFHKNVRSLIYSGKPSLFDLSRQGKPSVLFLLIRHRARMLRLFIRGKPSFARLMLEGEQSPQPSSLFRRLCTSLPEGEYSPMELILKSPRKDKSSRSLAQLMLLGSPSMARQFMGARLSKLTPLARMLFEGDTINGFPSLTYLLTLRDSFEGKQHPSVLESILQYEELQWELPMHELATAPMSLMRLLLMGKPSLFDLILDGERSGRGSLLRRIVTASNNDGLSIARMVLTSFDNQHGHRPALSLYLFGGENLEGHRSSILRLMIAAERRSDQLSIMRLLLYQFEAHPKTPHLLRNLSGLGKHAANKGDVSKGVAWHTSESDKLRGNDDDDDDDDDDDETVSGDPASPSQPRLFRNPLRLEKQRSLMDLLTAGSPSIAYLFFEGELQGEDSLARLMFGTSVDFKDGYLRLGKTLSEDNAGVSLMQMLLAGEEDSGPGISLMRLLLLGEEESGSSILRLLLTAERSSEPSLLRILIIALKAVLIAAKTRPNQFRTGEWRDHFKRIRDAIFNNQHQGGSPRSQMKSISDALNPQGGQLQAILGVLSTIRSRNKRFQARWKEQFLRVAHEIELAGERAHPGTLWHEMAPKWEKIAVDIGLQNWGQLMADVASSVSSLQGLSQWVERLNSKTPVWLRDTLRQASSQISSWQRSGSVELDPDDDYREYYH